MLAVDVEVWVDGHRTGVGVVSRNHVGSPIPQQAQPFRYRIGIPGRLDRDVDTPASGQLAHAVPARRQ